MFGRLSSASTTLLISGLMFCATSLYSQDVWNKPAFSVDAQALRAAADDIKAGKDADVTLFLNEFLISLDSTGKMLKKHHMIYRIENQEGVQGWSETRGTWDPWYQSRPRIDARVITTDGVVHSLDPKTLGDVPLHENSQDTYTDRKAHGGPLPALAPGAIVEEEVTTQDTSVFFSGGIVESLGLAWGVPVSKTRIVLSHPDSLPVRYVLHTLPQAVVNKTIKEGTETIVIEQGPLDAFSAEPPYLPPDALLYPELQFSTGASWQQMASAYARQVSEKLRASDVQSLVTKLELNSRSNLETIHKIVTKLHNIVRYTGVEFGESSIIPQFPAETLKRRYGDCKDKATLLVAMLRAAGIPSTLALLNAGLGEDTNPDLPGMGGFDHAIVYVPATSSSPELWIDATAEYSRVGELPEADYGRWALIVDEKTTALKKIPELTAEENTRIETREFRLAEYGPAQIIEKNEQTGPSEEDYRDYYDGDEKKIRENSESYVKDAYLADTLTSLMKTDPADLGKPFVVTLTAKGRRGFTGLENAVVYIPYSSIFNGFPQYFRTPEKTGKESGEENDKPRTFDWAITPFSTEWHYKITVPAGFKLRALPAEKDERFGTARFTQKYSSSQDGTAVEAVLKFESGKGRLSVEEAKVLRDAIVKARSSDGITITFDQVGYSLLSAGKIKEALVMDRRLVSAQPKEPLHRIRLAYVLLAAGLGEDARNTIKSAVALNPESATAFSAQGWILEHDLIGRRFGKGFDYQGAVSAYEKAKQLDPKEKSIRVNLAKLLEYDPDGLRYTKKARLEDAIEEFKELKKLDEDYFNSFADFIPYDLWYLGRYKELREYLSALSASDVTRSLTLAAIAATEGTDAATAKSLEIASEEQDRSKALVNAGWMLVRARRYPEAAELLAVGARGQANESEIAPRAALFRKTKRREDLPVTVSGPASAIQRLFTVFLDESPDLAKTKELMSKIVLQSSDPGADKLEFESARYQLRSLAGKSSLPLGVIADVVLSNIRFIPEGNDAVGYKIIIELPGGGIQDAFVVAEDGQYKVVEFSKETVSVPENIGWEVLARLQNKDLPGARKWLDWAREKVHMNTGDDPLSGHPFPRFWTKGQEGEENAIRTAALILLPSKSLRGENLAALVESRNQAKDDSTRDNLNLVLAYAYSAQERWSDLSNVASELIKTYPDSHTAYWFAARADAGLHRFDEWETLLQPRIDKHADEAYYLGSAAELARRRGQFRRAQEILKNLIDNGKANGNDLNLYAWDALFAPNSIDQDAVDAARRANDLTKNSNFNILHTLACLDAVTGKTKEARELLLKAMEERNLEEPNSAIWLGLGLIAEQYGEIDAARTMYSRVEQDKPETPASNYALAQLRLGGLQSGAVPAKPATQSQK